MYQRHLFTAVVAASCLLFASSANSQVQDSQQKEVWKAITAFTDAWKARNYKEVEKSYHKEFTGWYPEDPFPATKRQDLIWTKHLFATRNVKFILLHPMRIVVKGNVAVAQYYAAGMQTKKKKGEEKYSTIQWTDVWLKEGNSWKILATHGTRVKL